MSVKSPFSWDRIHQQSVKISSPNFQCNFSKKAKRQNNRIYRPITSFVPTRSYWKSVLILIFVFYGYSISFDTFLDTILEKLLDAISSQSIGEYELLIIDSSS